jgi:hypothetical protein
MSPVASDRPWLIVDDLYGRITVSDGELGENARRAAGMIAKLTVGLAASVALE